MTSKKQDGEFNTFNATVDAILAVPHSEIQRREAEYKKHAPKGEHKRGPKPRKAK